MNAYINFLVAVLASIENDIQSVSIFEAENVTFTCEFLKGTISNIDIDWTVDGDLFDECGSTVDDIAPDGNGCYTTDTVSVLVLRNTSLLATGSHPVQCVLEQNIPEDFKNDPSFQESFNIITRSALLTIETRSKHFPYTMYMNCTIALIPGCRATNNS